MIHDTRQDGSRETDRGFHDADEPAGVRDSATRSSDMTSSSAARPNSHKRNASSGLLARFLFSRSIDQDSDDQDSPDEVFAPRDESRTDLKHDAPSNTAHSPTEPPSNEPAKAQAVKTRKRKGSLRKVALLGGRAFSGDGRERRNSFLRSPTKALSPQSKPTTAERETSQDIQDDQKQSVKLPAPSIEPGRRSLGADQNDTFDTTLLSDTPAVTTARLSLLTAQTASAPATHDYTDIKQPSDTSGPTLSSPSDPKSPNSYASTTEDDDDGLSFSRPSTSAISVVSSEATYPPPPLPPANVSSYFPAASRALRPRSQNRLRPSPLQNTLAPAPELYPYAETEYWGWVILFVTWLSFTVGMGSCLDIWSWAWDVGETPYAPPELEDDPTLPIVGYYPALIVLTGVVAWVWITVAWIGMKYFRHAKIEV